MCLTKAESSRTALVKGWALMREVAHLHLVNFIIASGRATAATGPCSAEVRLGNLPHTWCTHTWSKHTWCTHTWSTHTPFELPSAAVAPGISLTGCPSVRPSVLGWRSSWWQCDAWRMFNRMSNRGVAFHIQKIRGQLQRNHCVMKGN